MGRGAHTDTEKKSGRGGFRVRAAAYTGLCLLTAALLVLANLPHFGTQAADTPLPEHSASPAPHDPALADPVVSDPDGTPAPPDEGTPAPVGAVGDEYFADAIFIGNSRTEGFLLYSGVKCMGGYAELGVTVNTVFTDRCIHLDGASVSIMDAVAAQPEFGKVYIMLGMNELGWVYKQPFIDGYARIIERLREINPDAVIYVQSILPVTKEKSDSDEIYNNERIAQFNERIAAMCEEEQVVYLHVAEAVTDEDGALPADAALDGIHLQKPYCKLWYEYLKAHTVSEEIG